MTIFIKKINILILSLNLLIFRRSNLYFIPIDLKTALAYNLVLV
jgi:hypothetical protein